VPFGRSLFALRSLSLVCGVLAVWLGYLFVREAFGQTRFALVAALMLAVNPFQIQYARETRMYAMGVCLVLLASSMLARALRTLQRRHWIAYGLGAAACLYTHYYLVFAVAAQALVAATVWLREPPPRRSRMFGSLALAYAVAAAAFAPWVPTFVQQTRRVQQDFWIPRLTLERVLRVPWALVLGGSDSGWTPVTWLIVATIVIFVLLAAAVRQARGWADWLVISQAAFPIAAGLALSAGRPIFLDRYFLFASAFWSILLAGLITRLSRPDVRQAAAAFIVLLSVAALARNLNAIGLVSIRHPVEKPGMAGAAALVNREARGGDDHSAVALFDHSTGAVSPLRRTGAARSCTDDLRSRHAHGAASCLVSLDRWLLSEEVPGTRKLAAPEHSPVRRHARLQGLDCCRRVRDRTVARSQPFKQPLPSRQHGRTSVVSYPLIAVETKLITPALL
jgi:4-amino-4-deoxy-L-arabinose transferase-like glycosyltransferase